MHLRSCAALLSSFSLCLLLTGCSLNQSASPVSTQGLAIQGKIHGGQQPINGAHIYLMAANTTGYGQPSTSLLTSGDGSDSIGNYVLSAADGSFSITGDYTCTPGAPTYLYALGGDTGAGVNLAAGLMAVLGNCPSSGDFSSSVPFISINEVSTVAAAYAMAPFATDATHVSGVNTALSLTGVQNAFANAANLADISSGSALALTPAGNGTVPQTRINTLANILAACIDTNSATSTNCSTLFSNTLSAGTTGTTPSDTATAAINMAHNPAVAISALDALQPAIGAPFGPALSATPNDLTLSIVYTTPTAYDATYAAADAYGNIWVPQTSSGVYKYSPQGAHLQTVTGPTLTYAMHVAVDPLTNNVWVGDGNSPAITAFDNSGTILSGSGYTGSGLDYAFGIAFDGQGSVWVTTIGNTIGEFNSSTGAPISQNGYTAGSYPSGDENTHNSIAISPAGYTWAVAPSALTEWSSAGAVSSGVNGFTGGGLSSPYCIAFDANDNAWVANSGSNSLSEFDQSGNGTAYTGGGLAFPHCLAIDGNNTVWALNGRSLLLSNFASDGTLLNSTGYSAAVPVSNASSLTIDGSGNIWVTSESSLVQFIGVAAPVVTPLNPGTVGIKPQYHFTCPVTNPGSGNARVVQPHC